MKKLIILTSLLLIASEVAAQKAYKIGDYYNEGGMKGIVFYVSADGKKGKIISLEEGDPFCGTTWSKINEYTGATSTTDGRINMQRIQAISGWREKYPAFAWCADMGEDWYIPASDELIDLVKDSNIYKAVDNALWEYGTPFGVGDIEIRKRLRDANSVLSVFASSTEINQSQIQYVSIWQFEPNEINRAPTEKTGYGYFVRAIARFDNSTTSFAPVYTGSSSSSSNTKHTHTDLGNGNYVETTTFDDGSMKTVTCSDCPYCFGQGQCPMCYGAGQTFVAAGVYSKYVPCTVCRTTGKCQFCGGEGKLIQVVWGNSNTGAFMGTTNGGIMTSGVVDMTNGGHDSNYSSGKQETSGSSHSRYGYSDCHLCHGTGVCQTCHGKGWYDSPYTSGTISCPNCYSGHRGKCSACQGTGQKYGVK